MTETNPDESDERPDDSGESSTRVGPDDGSEPNDGAEAADDEIERDVAADWMAPVDDGILEVMQENHVFAPNHIEEEGVCLGRDAATRCRKLAEYGLLERQAIGMYDLTELGERYLEGEVDPTELEPEDD